MGIIQLPFTVNVHDSDRTISNLQGHHVSVLKVLAIVVVIIAPLSVIVKEFGSFTVDGFVSEPGSLGSWCAAYNVVSPKCGVVLLPSTAVEHVSDTVAVYVSGLEIVILKVLGPVLVVVSPLAVVVKESYTLTVNVSVCETYFGWSWTSFVQIASPSVCIIRLPFSTVVHVSNSFSIDISSNNSGLSKISRPVSGIVWHPATLEVKHSGSSASNSCVPISCPTDLDAWYHVYFNATSITNSRKKLSSSISVSSKVS